MDEGWPFRGADAVSAGLVTTRQLARDFQAAYPGVYVPRAIELSAVQRARAAWLWSRGRAVVAGLSASALHGAKWIEAGLPAELIHANRRPPIGITVHSDTVLGGETIQIAGMTVTTAARTAFDIGRRLPVTEGVQRLDALMKATRLGVDDVRRVTKSHPGVRGLAILRETLALVNGGAESPYESLTRLMLVRAGLPQPLTQIRVTDEFGRVVAYLDMGWPDKRVAVEFDGAQHWTDARQRRRDIERWAELEMLGWIIIRVSSDMLRTPAAVIERVRRALHSR